MTQSTKKLLTTAAFAALASTALPSFAQEAPATPEATAPAVADPAPVVVQAQPAPPVALPQVAAGTPTPVAPAPATTVLKMPELEAPTAPISRAERTATRTPTAAAAVNRRAAPAAPAAPEPNTMTPTPTSNTIPAPEELAPAPSSVSPNATAETVNPATSSADTDWATIGGIAAVGGAAALGIGGLALIRRRRDDDTAEFDTSAVVERHPLRTGDVERAAMAVEPATVPVQPMLRSAPAGEGRHVRAAMEGPTAENPFLTERARMRRARFLDKREALARAENPAAHSLGVDDRRVASVARDAQFQTTYRLNKAKPSGFGSWLRPAKV